MEAVYEIVFILLVFGIWVVVFRPFVVKGGEIVKGQLKRQRVQRGVRGVTMVEYAIMIALIAVAVAVMAPGITSAVVGVFVRASSVMVPH